jgi:predicted Zn-dependent protease
VIRILEFLLIVFILFIAAACAPRPHVIKVADDTPLTAEQETQLGHVLSSELVQHLGGDYPVADLEKYINQIARRLMTDSGNQLKQVRVANHSGAYSVPLTGGIVVVTRGLLQELDSELQLAALLAREAGHFQAGHVAENMRALVRGRAVFLQNVQPEDPGYSQRLLLIRELTDGVLRKGYGSQRDNSADIVAIDLLVRGGYPLYGFFELDDMWQRLNRADAVAGRPVSPSQLSSQRLQAARDYIAASYPGDRGNRGLDRTAFIRQMASLHQSAPAYQLYDQARYAEAAGEHNKALQLYHQAIQQQQSQSLLLTALGMAYLRGEDLIPARRYLRQAVTADGDYYQSRLGLGYIHLRRAEWSEAVAEIETSLALLPTVQGVFLLAEAEEGRGNAVRARNLYLHLVAVDGQSALGRAAAERLRQLPR